MIFLFIYKNLKQKIKNKVVLLHNKWQKTTGQLQQLHDIIDINDKTKM